MRYYFIFALCFGLAAQSLAQEPEFPYNAIVLSDGAQVHSGPGDTHYATHDLDENDLVEVYRHDPGGWCAIRPPAKSFSLIPEAAVKIVGKDSGGRDIAQILANGTQAWVGTVLGPVEKPLWQVKLKKGEKVSVVGKATWPHPSGKSIVWLQVEPPAGEYRWIRLSDLQLPPAKDSATKVDFSEPPSLNRRQVQSGFSKVKIARKKEEPAFKISSVTASSSGWKAATRPVPKDQPEQAKAVQYSGTFGRPGGREIDREGDFVEQVTFLQEEPSDPRFESWDGSNIPGITDKPASSSERFSPPDRFASRESMREQTRSYVREPSTSPRIPSANAQRQAARENSSLMKIEEQLSEEILKDPQSWNMTELKFATERAKAVSDDPVERLAFQHVLDKIARCDKLRKGYQQASPFAASAAPGQAMPSVASVGDRTYDATGWLKRLASSSGSIDPTYVLEDSLGNVTHEVVGSAGMNLGQYVDKQVGAIGRRGFNRRLNLKHVTVDRVIVLR